MSILTFIPDVALQLKFVQLKNEEFALLIGIQEVPAKKGKGGHAAHNRLATINHIVNVTPEGHIQYDEVIWLLETDIKEIEPGVTVYIKNYPNIEDLKNELAPFVKLTIQYYQQKKEKQLSYFVSNLKNNIQEMKEICHSDLEGLVSECKSKQNTIQNRGYIPSSFSNGTFIGSFNDRLLELRVKQEIFEQLDYFINDPLLNLK